MNPTPDMLERIAQRKSGKPRSYLLAGAQEWRKGELRNARVLVINGLLSMSQSHGNAELVVPLAQILVQIDWQEKARNGFTADV